MVLPPSRKRILLIEDDHFSRMVFSLMLRRLGFDVEATYDGIQGLKRFQEDHFDLIVLDLLLPGMSGFQTALQLRGIEQSTGRPKTPILALTASPLTETQQLSLESGITEWASKPITSFNLALLIERCLCPLPSNPDSPIRPGESSK